MKRLLGVVMFSALFALVATGASSLIMVRAQQNPSAPNPPTQQEPAPVRLFEGELLKVDATAKTITAKGPSDSETIFAYGDETQMAGLDNGVQGLAGNIGSSLKISYRNESGTNRAIKIEVILKH